ncbi:GTP cyclohydrolase, FolE2/MptA family, partial [Klebsiella pneumoniae]
MILLAENVFRCAPFCEAFDIRVEHQESLHPHNAVA